MKNDLISRQAAIDSILAVTGNSSVRELYEHIQEHELSDMWSGGVNAAIDIIIALPPADTDLSAYSDKLWKLAYERGKKEASLYGYKIEHLGTIAMLLEKENLPPERVSDALYDINQVVAIVVKEFEEILRKALVNNE